MNPIYLIAAKKLQGLGLNKEQKILIYSYFFEREKIAKDQRSILVLMAMSIAMLVVIHSHIDRWRRRD